MNVSIILAAGEGTRMKSSIPKVLHKVAGKTILSYVVDNCKANAIDKNVVIVGHKKDEVMAHFEDRDLTFIEQEVGEGIPYGTGYAVSCAIDEFDDDDMVYILTGDTPLFKEETIAKFMNYVESHDFDACVLTAIVKNPFGYGRIIRGVDSDISGIVEEKDASDKEKAITEVNTGIFAFKGRVLRENIGNLSTDNNQKELYLTDIIRLLRDKGQKIGGFTIGCEEEMLGINSRVQLARCEHIMRRRINEKHMENGVSFLNPETTMVDFDVEIGCDTVIDPGVHLEGETKIGKRCRVRGNSRISDSVIADDVEIESSVIESSKVGENVTIGPFAHLRPNSVLEKDVHIGNFVEVKKSRVGEGTKAGHLAYIGDGDVGSGVNISCGVIFCNYNGKEKFKTVVGDDAFIGSNANLVAPVEIGEGAFIAAGSTITKNVEGRSLAVERSEQRNIPGWTKRKDR
ncbi:MAG: bifunctional UDP-N-acetylglucosamine diphosphorylase/glucosamine-1-phosphate N-acetyltransferase GlmU [Peptoniphilus sp.]|nr:bifunctional UDP-N-acetylglucosamine diphosphorylase/glucosamine-1-phosphate N-acetyltransferase GlmU [Peptoniphilus sp.]MDD7362795.1 bifunctional UDP-N-acetylglucosamine diphosphorylase/glucosamine-1-phosphate N-acetyltransferase GlmU [Bacillota bacterium]MDY6044013.1 bifunctional UDP-N-acetylglucosamine diphosphorylase/glucosamine-1-phosphate N-acetyltransferase GlmU [Peptoniphilus sp.]